MQADAGGGSAPVNIGLYGANGHQVHDLLVGRPTARLIAVAEFPVEKIPAPLRPGVTVYHDLDDLLSDPRIEVVSLCSPRRRDQAAHAVRALRAGKHVYAEKPCAFTEGELDQILRVARESGRMFREMAGTAFEQPYLAMREAVRSGRIGRVVQVIAEKSYPYFAGRPQDEDVDGGLIRQAAVHALRFVEHVAGVPICSIRAIETTAGNPVAGGGLRMAASLIIGLEGGGVGSIAANYLNPRGTGTWGYERLRIIGEDGFVESNAADRSTRLVVGECDFGTLPITTPGLDYFDAYLAVLQGRGEMPLRLEEELSPTRWVIRAKQSL